jgi:hypothetical protein
MSVMSISNTTFNTIFNDISKLNNDDNGRIIDGGDHEVHRDY